MTGGTIGFEGKPSGGEFSWIALLSHLWAARAAILRVAAAAALASAVVLLIVPETYRARTVLLPPQADDRPGLAKLLSTAGTPILGLGSTNVSSEIFVEILNSRTVAEAVIDSLGLIETYGLSDRARPVAIEAARRVLGSRCAASSSIDGVVTVEASERTGLFPRFRGEERRRAANLAAEIANAFVRELDRVNVEKSTSGARSARIYLEGQIAQVQEDRRRAAEALLEFQSRYGAVSLEEQTRLALETSGKLDAEILARRLELNFALRTESESSPRVRSLRMQIEEMEEEQARLLGLAGNGTPAAGGSPAARSLDPRPGNEPTAPGDADGDPEPSRRTARIPVGALPQLALRYADLWREVKSKELLLEILTQQYYDARLEESRTTPTVQVLDEAIPPTRKSAPKRIATVVLAGFLGAVAGSVGVLVVDARAARRARE